MMRAAVAKVGVHRVVLALSCARLGDAIGNSLLFVVIPPYVAQLPSTGFPFSETIRVGILISAYGFFGACGEPLSGSMIDRLGHHKLMVQLGLAIMAASLLAYIPASRYLWLLALRGVQGIGLAITVPATLALMATVTRTETRGRAMGFYSSSRMVGIALGPIIGGFVQVHFGFTATFFVGAGCIALAVLLVQLFVVEPRRAAPERPERAPDQPSFFDRRIWSAGITTSAIAMMAMASAFSVMATLEKQFDEMLGIDAFLFAIALSSSTVSRLLCQVPLGWLSDRHGRRPIIIGGLLLLIPAIALQGWSTSLWQVVVLRIVQGIASAGVAAPAFALAADETRSGGQGRQLSITTVGFSLGLAVGPLLGGFLVGYFFALPFVMVAVLCLVAAWLVYRYAPETVDVARTPLYRRSPKSE